MDRKNFLLIEHGGGRKQFTLQALQEKGLTVYLACTSIPNWVKRYIPKDSIITTDTYNSTKLLTDVLAFSESHKIKFDAIGTFYEHVVAQTADIASALGLIGLNPGAARRSSHNKILTRIICREHNIPTPKFTVVNAYSPGELKKAVHRVGTPCVVKPVFGAESYGTVKIEKNTSLSEVIDEIKLNTTQNKKEIYKNFTGTCLVEKYLPGSVISIDGLAQNRQIMIAGSVEFIMGPEPRFTQEANYIPARINPVTYSQCVNMTKKIVSALGFDNCGFHCEQRVTPDGPILIEIAARLPGGPLQPGYKMAYGIDLTSHMIDIWLGKTIKIKSQIKNFVLQKAVFPKQKGKIKKMSGLDQVKKLKGVWDFFKIAKLGEEVTTYPDIPKPFYYYAIAANSPQEVDQLSKKVEQTIKVVVK